MGKKNAEQEYQRLKGVIDKENARVEARTDISREVKDRIITANWDGLEAARRHLGLS